MNEPELFAMAMGIADPVKRAAFLDRECAGRQDVRQRLDLLLEEHRRSDHALDTGGPNVTASYTPATELEETIISGRYKLLEQIGEARRTTRPPRIQRIQLKGHHLS